MLLKLSLSLLLLVGVVVVANPTASSSQTCLVNPATSTFCRRLIVRIEDASKNEREQMPCICMASLVDGRWNSLKKATTSAQYSSQNYAYFRLLKWCFLSKDIYFQLEPEVYNPVSTMPTLTPKTEVAYLPEGSPTEKQFIDHLKPLLESKSQTTKDLLTQLSKVYEEDKLIHDSFPASMKKWKFVENLDMADACFPNAIQEENAEKAIYLDQILEHVLSCRLAMRCFVTLIKQRLVKPSKGETACDPTSDPELNHFKCVQKVHQEVSEVVRRAVWANEKLKTTPTTTPATPVTTSAPAPAPTTNQKDKPLDCQPKSKKHLCHVSPNNFYRVKETMETPPTEEKKYGGTPIPFCRDHKVFCRFY